MERGKAERNPRYADRRSPSPRSGRRWVRIFSLTHCRPPQRAQSNFRPYLGLRSGSASLHLRLYCPKTLVQNYALSAQDFQLLHISTVTKCVRGQIARQRDCYSTASGSERVGSHLPHKPGGYRTRYCISLSSDLDVKEVARLSVSAGTSALSVQSRSVFCSALQCINNNTT